ncbi:hypothetical protein JC607_23335 [Paracoccus sp. IB05]|nr:hypothetical protein [Paracoccus sp. IB05]
MLRELGDVGLVDTQIQKRAIGEFSMESPIRAILTTGPANHFPPPKFGQFFRAGRDDREKNIRNRRLIGQPPEFVVIRQSADAIQKGMQVFLSSKGLVGDIDNRHDALLILREVEI